MEHLSINNDPMEKAVRALLEFLKETRTILPAPTQTAEQVDDLPLIMEAKHITKLLGISKTKTYELMLQSDFPVILLDGRKLVRRDKFFEWLSSKEARSTQMTAKEQSKQGVR